MANNRYGSGTILCWQTLFSRHFSARQRSALLWDVVLHSRGGDTRLWLIIIWDENAPSGTCLPAAWVGRSSGTVSLTMYSDNQEFAARNPVMDHESAAGIIAQSTPRSTYGRMASRLLAGVVAGVLQTRQLCRHFGADLRSSAVCAPVLCVACDGCCSAVGPSIMTWQAALRSARSGAI